MRHKWKLQYRGKDVAWVTTDYFFTKCEAEAAMRALRDEGKSPRVVRIRDDSPDYMYADDKAIMEAAVEFYHNWKKFGTDGFSVGAELFRKMHEVLDAGLTDADLTDADQIAVWKFMAARNYRISRSSRKVADGKLVMADMTQAQRREAERLINEGY